MKNELFKIQRRKTNFIPCLEMNKIAYPNL